MTDRYRHLSAQPTHTTTSPLLLDDPADAVIATDYLTSAPDAASELERERRTVAASGMADYLSNFSPAGNEAAAMNALPPVIVADGATVEIEGDGAHLATFAGTTGTLVIDDAAAFNGQISGLTRADALDLADLKYGSTTTATFAGSASGGVLTVSNGIQTANIALIGDYVHSGWTLSSDGHGGTVVVDPPLTGMVYPNATNTGITSGTVLKQATSNTITTPGVYNGLIFNGTVIIECSNVTLENCVVKDTNSDWTGVYIAGGLKNVVIQNSEIAGAGVNSTVTGTYGICVAGDSQVSIYNNNIHDVGSPFAVGGGQVVIEGNYAHDFYSGPGTHYNGMQVNGVSNADFSLLMENNSIINNQIQTDAIMIDNEAGPINNVTITNNLLTGGDYTVYVDGSKSSNPITNVNISNNDLGTGIYGYWYLSQGSLSNANYQVTTSGNVDDAAALAAALPSARTVNSAPVATLSSMVESPASGDLNVGQTVTLTLKLDEAVAVAGGTPTLTLNDGGTATYSGGSGTSALTFSYTVAAGQNTSSLAATAVNLNSATIKDSAGTAADLSFSGPTQSGPQIDTTSPVVTSLGDSPATGTLNVGSTVTLTVKLSEAVTVAGGTPILTLNDGGTATYTGGSGTNALTFSYTVANGQNTADLTVTALNLNAATIHDGAGNAADLSLTGVIQSGPQIDTTAPTGSSPSPTPTGSSGSPPAPTITSLSPNQGTATASGGYTDAHKLTLSGTAVANSEVEVFDRSTRLGTATVGSRGAWTYATPTLSDGTHDFTAKDVHSAGNVSAASTMFDVTVVSPASLTKTGNTYDITAAAADPVLKYKGANVTISEFADWTPIGAVKTASGYDVAWKNTRTNQYTVWTADNNGNYTGNLIGTVSANSTQWTSIAPIFQQTVNSGGTDPTTKLIQKDGSTSLTEIANHYNLDGSGSDPTLKYKGRSVTAGEFGKWTPIGAVKTATGYDVAWKNTGSGQYTVWSTDSNGNYKGFLTGGAVSGTSSALESLEPVFRQDLNRDGVIGLTTRKVVHTAVVNHTTQKVIQKDGSTSLTEVGNRYYDLDGSNGSGPTLKYKGRSVTAGEFGAWTPIGAIQTASGYDVAWKNTGTGQYTVWGTDSNGNYKGFLTGGAVSGTSSALESLEPIFHQDLNRDGVIGLTTRKVVHTAVVNHTTQKVIQKDGSTSLTEVGNRYYDLDGSNGSGPTLKYKGRSVTAGEFGAWTPIGAIQTASGYDVAWKNTGTGQYTVWGTDSNGNYKGFLTGGAVSGTSSALEPLEPIFHQDLNRDGVIGLDAAPGKTLQISQALGGTSGSATIGTGATLELTAADSAPVTFAGPTGTLRLDHSSTFSGKISKFGGNGSLSGSDHIDLRDVKYSSVHDSYSNGVLTVTDGSGDTAKLSFNGSYSLANFKFANDGSGGTIVYDPPTASSEQTADVGSPASISRSATTATADLPRIAFDVESMLGNLPDRNQAGGKSLPDAVDEAKIALLGNYMASMFATNGSHTGITSVAEVPQPNDHSVLSSPSHA